MKRIICIFLLLLTACQSTKIYYNDTSYICGGEIWGSQLNLFFTQDEEDEWQRIKITESKSKKLYKQLQNIKKQIISCDSEKIYYDSVFLYANEMFYDYAFITSSNDTLYCYKKWGRWRYKNKVIELDSVVLDIDNTKNKKNNY